MIRRLAKWLIYYINKDMTVRFYFEQSVKDGTRRFIEKLNIDNQDLIIKSTIDFIVKENKDEIREKIINEIVASVSKSIAWDMKNEIYELHRAEVLRKVTAKGITNEIEENMKNEAREYIEKFIVRSDNHYSRVEMF